jgi:hypothetical protein
MGSGPNEWGRRVPRSPLHHSDAVMGLRFQLRQHAQPSFRNSSRRGGVLGRSSRPGTGVKASVRLRSELRRDTTSARDCGSSSLPKRKGGRVA